MPDFPVDSHILSIMFMSAQQSIMTTGSNTIIHPEITTSLNISTMDIVGKQTHPHLCTYGQHTMLNDFSN